VPCSGVQLSQHFLQLSTYFAAGGELAGMAVDYSNESCYEPIHSHETQKTLSAVLSMFIG